MKILADGAERLGIRLTPDQLSCFEEYYRELTDWNQRMNLTAITDYHEVQVRHFLDSLTLALVIPPPQEGLPVRLIDVGTGAGLPGIPLKILYPSIKLTLLESVAKKTRFLRHLVDRLKLEDVEIIAGRAEDAAREPSLRERFDYAVARAVSPLCTLTELTLPFCRLGGQVITPKKGNITEEIEVATSAIALLGGELQEVKSVYLPEFGEERKLVVISKVRPTPAKYPRRAGMPAKQPLLN